MAAEVPITSHINDSESEPNALRAKSRQHCADHTAVTGHRMDSLPMDCSTNTIGY
jgi:hypothetical protein